MDADVRRCRGYNLHDMGQSSTLEDLRHTNPRNLHSAWFFGEPRRKDVPSASHLAPNIGCVCSRVRHRPLSHQRNAEVPIERFESDACEDVRTGPLPILDRPRRGGMDAPSTRSPMNPSSSWPQALACARRCTHCWSLPASTPRSPSRDKISTPSSPWSPPASASLRLGITTVPRWDSSQKRHGAAHSLDARRAKDRHGLLRPRAGRWGVNRPARAQPRTHAPSSGTSGPDPQARALGRRHVSADASGAPWQHLRRAQTHLARHLLPLEIRPAGGTFTDSGTGGPLTDPQPTWARR